MTRSKTSEGPLPAGGGGVRGAEGERSARVLGVNATEWLSPSPGRPRSVAEARKVRPLSARSMPVEPPIARTYTWRRPGGVARVTPVRQEGLRVRRSARSAASETNAPRVQRPSIATSDTVPLDCRRPLLTDTRRIEPVRRSRTNASGRPLVSPGTRLEAAETNATQWGASREVPSSPGRDEGPLAGAPPMPPETSRVAPGCHGVPFSP